MLTERTCDGSMGCVDGALIVVDTSHLTFLARGALALVESAGAAVLDVFHRLVRAMSCWSDRLRTSPLVFDNQVACDPEDSVVHETLGVHEMEPAFEWVPMIQKSDELLAHHYRARAAAAGPETEEHDLELIGYAAASATSNDVYLVSNDEKLLTTANTLVDRLNQSGDGPPHAFVPIDSIGLMKRLLNCAGIDGEIMAVLLITEYQDVVERPMNQRTRLKKVRRLESAARELSIDVHGAPDPENDADLRTFFLEWEENQS